VFVAVKSLYGQVVLISAEALNEGFTLVVPFNEANWRTPITFTVATLDDSVAEWSEADLVNTTPAPSEAPVVQ
jgi:hypothetical protein